MKFFKLAAFLFLATAFIACSSDDDHQSTPNSNYFTYNGNTYSLKDGVIQNGGTSESADQSHTYYVAFSTDDLELHQSGIYLPTENSFSIVNVNLISDDDHKPRTGTYNYNEDYPIKFTFKDGISFINAQVDWDQIPDGEIDLNEDDFEWEDRLFVKGGTVKVKQSGNVYEVDFDLVMDNNKKIKGNYTGALKVNPTDG